MIPLHPHPMTPYISSVSLAASESFLTRYFSSREQMTINECHDFPCTIICPSTAANNNERWKRTTRKAHILFLLYSWVDKRRKEDCVFVKNLLFVYATHALNVVMVAPGNGELSTSPPQRIPVYVPPTTRSKSTRYRGKYLIKNSGLASQL